MMMLRWTLLMGLVAFPNIAFGQEVVSVADADPFAEGVTQMADEVRDMPVATTVRLIMILTALTFVPAILLVMTPFTRFIIVFSMLRQAICFLLSTVTPHQKNLINLELKLELRLE